MKELVFYFDPISPFAYLAFERLPQVLEGCSYAVEYRPVLLAGCCSTGARRARPKIEPKRAWTFRQVHWLAQQQGTALDTPAQHPFNPLPLLRLALASSADMRPNRRVVQALLRHVWVGGADASDPARLAALTQEIAPVLDPAGPAVKQALREHTEAAVQAGVFGVPSISATAGCSGAWMRCPCCATR
jgi:2-hydroxychromene-2-carboxylate isomerase